MSYPLHVLQNFLLHLFLFLSNLSLFFILQRSSTFLLIFFLLLFLLKLCLATIHSPHLHELLARNIILFLTNCRRLLLFLLFHQFSGLLFQSLQIVDSVIAENCTWSRIRLKIFLKFSNRLFLGNQCLSKTYLFNWLTAASFAPLIPLLPHLACSRNIPSINIHQPLSWSFVLWFLLKICLNV